ncbi:MAG: class I SAM-dependent methyltransferase [Pseudomonadota bacterium]
MIERIRRYPAVLALLAQLAAVLLVWVGVLLYAQATGQRASLLTLGLVQGLLAAALGQWGGLARWWLPLNGLFVPGLLVLNGQSLPAGFWLGGLLLLALLNWNSLKDRVPLYLSGPRTRDKLVELLGEQPAAFALVDLGCGFAGTLCQLANRYPRAHLVGYETAPLVFLVAWLRCLPRRNCRVYFRSLWQAELAAFDAVYCFLSPAPMPALWAKARAEMRPGALLVSNSFAVPGVTAERVIEVDDWRRSRLLIWRPGGPSRG